MVVVSLFWLLFFYIIYIRCSMIYYMAGVWDLFHVGHLKAIKMAREIAGKDFLIIGVVSDEHAKDYKNKNPFISFKHRFQLIKELPYADKVVKQEVQFDISHMKRLGVNEVLLGDDWKENNPPHLQKMRECVKVTFIPRMKEISTSLIIKALNRRAGL